MELLKKYHEGIKAEIETRSKNFSACLELGESLLQRQHQASDEVRGRRDRGQPPPGACPSGQARRLPGRELWFLRGRSPVLHLWTVCRPEN